MYQRMGLINMMGSYGFIERIVKEGEKYLRVHYLDSNDDKQSTDYFAPDWLVELEDKLKHYTEPFELRPTYQALEQMLDKIKALPDCEFNTPKLRELIKEILKGYK